MNLQEQKRVYDYTHLSMETAKRQDSLLGRILGRNKPKVNALAGLMAGLFAGGALAATYNYKGGYLAGTNLGQVATNEAFSVIDIPWNFATIAAARVAAGATALTTADVLQLASLLAYTWVPAVFVRTVTAEGATMTVDVGDGTDPDGYINDGDINAAGMVSSFLTTPYSVAVGGGKLYTADDTIDLIPNNATPVTAVLHLIVIAVDLRTYRST